MIETEWGGKKGEMCIRERQETEILLVQRELLFRSDEVQLLSCDVRHTENRVSTVEVAVGASIAPLKSVW